MAWTYGYDSQGNPTRQERRVGETIRERVRGDFDAAGRQTSWTLDANGDGQPDERKRVHTTTLASRRPSHARLDEESRGSSTEQASVEKCDHDEIRGLSQGGNAWAFSEMSKNPEVRTGSAWFHSSDGRGDRNRL